MNDFIKLMKSQSDFCAGKPAEQSAIENAEKSLELKFSDDYRKYVMALGFAIYDSHELTGVTAVKRLNVEKVTSEERKFNPDISADWYVIEQLHIDDVVIWQSTSGEIFQTQPNVTPYKIADSLSEYIKSTIS